MQEPLNKPYDWDADRPQEIGVHVIGGGGRLYLRRAEVEEYNRDPDAYAARELGYPSADAYREHVRCGGTAMCGGITSAGRLCRNGVGQTQLSFETWKQRHRRVFCAAHQDQASGEAA